MRPRLLDLFCGAGGAAMGYHRAGFDVVGVDVRPQPRYPFEFVQDDALDLLRGMLDYPDVFSGELGRFDAIHASPPCQAYSRMRHLPWLKGRDYPALLEATREQLRALGIPYVIENVEDAPMMKAAGLFGEHGVVLCGRMFGLPLYRHRPFESNLVLAAPYHPRHTVQGRDRRINTRRSQRTEILTIAGHSTGWTPDEQRAAMGIPWMTRDELTQSIPPAYTQFIGEQLMAHLLEAADA